MANDKDFIVKNGLIVGGNLTVNGTAPTSFSANTAYGDNVRAIFGDGSDLSIYHDGSNSFIDDAGTGILAIRGSAVHLQKYTGETLAAFNADGNCDLRYDNSIKLVTTSTGIDVTGTVVADGLTVQADVSSAIIESTNAAGEAWKLQSTYTNTGGSYGSFQVRDEANNIWMRFNQNNGSDEIDLRTANTDRLNIASNGDISFYEDTGTTAKFFWDASTERLGIGTTSPVVALDVRGRVRVIEDTSIVDLGSSATYAYLYNRSNSAFLFGTNDTERMRIDSSGNLLVGTTTLNSGTLGSTNTFAELAGSANGSGTLILSRQSNTNNDEVGGIRFVNSNNFDDDGLDADGKLIAGISARTDTSDSNANDDAGAHLVFYTKPEAGNYAERMRIDSSGNVLVNGTVAAASTGGLTLNNATSGSLAYQLFLRSSGTANSSGSGIGFRGVSNLGAEHDYGYINVVADDTTAKTGSMRFSTTAGSSPVERMRIDSAGNVGIGTTAPVERLDIQNTTNVAARIYTTNTNGIANLILRNDAEEIRIRVNGGNSDALEFCDGTTPRIVMTPAGNVGIGTTNPTQLMMISGSSNPAFSTNNTSGPSANFYTTTGTGVIGTGSNHSFELHSNNTERMRIHSGGGVSIGTSSSPNNAPLLIHCATDDNLRFKQETHASIQAVNDAANAFVELKLDGSSLFLNSQSGGNVGIGTTTPGRPLHISSSNNAPLKVDSSDGNQASIAFAQSTTDKWYVGVDLSANGSENFFIYDANATSNRFIIDNSGNVGIGTTSPGSTLHVVGTNSGSVPLLDLRASGTGTYQRGVRLLNTSLSAGEDIMYAVGNGDSAYNMGQLYFHKYATGNVLNRISIGLHSADDILNVFGSSNVVIGNTTYEGYRLEVVSDNAANNLMVHKKNATGTGAATNIAMQVTQTNGQSARLAEISSEFVSGWGGHLVFSTKPANGTPNNSTTERMRIASDGKVYVGTTGAFDNVSYTILQSQGGLATKIPGTAATTQVSFFNDNGRVGYIGTSGTSTSYNTSSDYRLKENVVDLTGAIDRIKQVPVHRFNFISEPDKTIDGFIAHEVSPIVPEAVTGEKDAVNTDGNIISQGIDQSKLVPLLTAALQEAITEIENLKTRIEAIENA